MIGISHVAWRLRCTRGQSLVEFALVMPFMLVLGLGIIEMSFVLLDQHIVTKLAREGANLISRDSSLSDAASSLSTMSSRPVNFSSGSKVIFSVLKRGATTGTSNFDQLILYQRHEYGSYSGQSKLTTRGGGSFTGPNYEAANSDNNTGLQVTNLPSDLILARGGMIYVTEIFTTHQVLTPLDRLGISMPTTLYSIAYF
jgi:hypothetical protein